MRIPDIHEPDPNHPEGMAWVFAAGICDPRPGGYPKNIHPNQQWALKQSWEPTSRMFWDLGLRWHPELQTKWLEGGGQFVVAKIVDKKPEEHDFQELVKQFAEDQNRKMAEEIQHVMAHGTEYEKSRLKQRYALMAKQSAEMAARIEDMLTNLPDEQNLDKHTMRGRKIEEDE